MTSIQYQQALKTLEQFLQAIKNRHEDWQQIHEDRDEVLARYQPIFSPENLPTLSTQDFISFLYLENNKHWSPIYRQRNQITADMELLRQGLLILTDETRPIQERMDLLRPSGKEPMIKGLNRAVLTPILLVLYPDNYGVWNNTSASGMKKLNIWPELPRGSSFGEQYDAINQVLRQLRDDLGIDFWMLDVLWGHIRDSNDEEDDLPSPASIDLPSEGQRFGLEKYLQVFIFDNWENIEDFKDWNLYEEEDEVVGMEYDTREIGRIDLLAKHKTKPEWLVIELKKDQSSDQTIGQVQRYMGWVEQNLAMPGDKISGLVISRNTDTRLSYALRYAKGVELMLYEVQFSLNKQDGKFLD